MSIKIKIFTLLLACFFCASTALAALSCTVSTTCNSPDVVVLRMANTANSHAELPSQGNYSQLVCCSGVASLSNSCSNSFGVLLRLSGDTNAHVEENTQNTATYNGHNACISVPSGTVTVGYQDNSCSGFDTTVVSMATPTTNSHVGDGSTYTRKVCASVSTPPPPPALCSNISCASGGLTGDTNTTPNQNKNPVDETTRNQILALSDFNSDGKVNILDLSILLYWTNQPYEKIPGSNFSRYDLNKDGKIDFLDISILFYYWDLIF